MFSVGNYHTHPPHDIRLYVGVYICVKGGAIAANGFTDLKDRCEQPTAALKYIYIYIYMQKLYSLFSYNWCTDVWDIRAIWLKTIIVVKRKQNMHTYFAW